LLVSRTGAARTHLNPLMADEEKKQAGRDGRATEQTPKRKPLNRKLALIGGMALACILAVIALLWWLHARHYESTDDAFIDAHVVRIAPRIAGQVARVLVRDNQLVNAGDLLIEIDGADPQSRLIQVTSQRVGAQTQLDQIVSAADNAKAQREAAAEQVRSAAAQ
jgi:membrane fusion protein (multidrug efflux system)